LELFRQNGVNISVSKTYRSRGAAQLYRKATLASFFFLFFSHWFIREVTMLTFTFGIVLLFFLPLALLPLALFNFFSHEELSEIGVHVGNSRP
jgi:hypothetical protein